MDCGERHRCGEVSKATCGYSYMLSIVKSKPQSKCLCMCVHLSQKQLLFVCEGHLGAIKLDLEATSNIHVHAAYGAYVGMANKNKNVCLIYIHVLPKHTKAIQHEDK